MTVRWESVQRGLSRHWLGRGEQKDGRLGPPGDRIQLEQVRMVGVDLSRLRLDLFSACRSEFVRCDFSRADFRSADFGSTTTADRWDLRSWPMSVYRECDFTRTRLPSLASFGNARFENCLFDGTFVRTTSTHEAQFVGCTFRGRVKARFWGRPDGHLDALGRDRNEFAGNDFTAADVTRVTFRDIDLGAQRFAAPG